MNSSLPVLSVNLLPPDKLYFNFTYLSSLFSQDMQVLWDRAHGIPLEKLPKGVSDMIFPYLLLALSDYRTSQIIPDTSGDFIDNAKPSNDAKLQNHNYPSKSIHLNKENQEAFDLQTYKKFLSFLKFQEMMDRYNEQ